MQRKKGRHQERFYTTWRYRSITYCYYELSHVGDLNLNKWVDGKVLLAVDCIKRQYTIIKKLISVIPYLMPKSIYIATEIFILTPSKD